jgi:Golgi SNAP receptor complex protein 2
VTEEYTKSLSQKKSNAFLDHVRQCPTNFLTSHHRAEITEPEIRMTSIVELFPKCRKLAYDSRQQLAQVQNGVLHPSDLFCSLDELSNQLDMMNQLVLRETPAQREVWKRKIQEIREEQVGVRRQGEHYDKVVNTNVRHQKERDELLTRRRNRKQQYSSTDERDNLNLADEAKSWNQSQYMVTDLIANGEASLNTLVDQRRRMTGVSKFLGLIDDRLGISNSTMKVIERRDVTDAYFVLGGCVITCIVIYFTWF